MWLPGDGGTRKRRRTRTACGIKFTIAVTWKHGNLALLRIIPREISNTDQIRGIRTCAICPREMIGLCFYDEVLAITTAFEALFSRTSAVGSVDSGKAYPVGLRLLLCPLNKSMMGSGAVGNNH